MEVAEEKPVAELINLRQARKARDRKAKEASAETNRIKYGRKKAERKREDAERANARRLLDGHVLERLQGASDDSEA
ncbi:DUF4169 family protein [Rhodospirillum sp. A1_3_36]|uniref:DUF4169 family protein n=1 Tax=Rhodospirillum sp. A1_3_36 TaxID=3391666 RepID=UPI0039A4FA1D